MNRRISHTHGSLKRSKFSSLQQGYVYKRGVKDNSTRNYKRIILGFLAFNIILLTLISLLLFNKFKGNSISRTTTSPIATIAGIPIIVSAPITTLAPTAVLMPSITPLPTEAPTAWGSKFPGKFTDGKVIQTDNTYKSAHINVTVNKVQESGVTYYLADIYMTDLKYFKTAFANNGFDNGTETTPQIAKSNNAIIAINGDYCSFNKGPVLRNGILYRDQSYRDALVMYSDGTMETFTKGEFDIQQAQMKAAYQIWTFGPKLLDDGEPMIEFNSSLGKRNPRTAVGYFEPGHYCFIVVDGRQGSYSKGITFAALSQLFHDLGCKVAFNLDGGQTSEMAFMGKFVNQPYHDGRAVSDILYIADE